MEYRGGFPAFDSDYNMYITNAGNSSVTVYAANWTAGNTAPTKTLSGNNTGLNDPYGVAFDSDDNMHITNTGIYTNVAASVTVYAAGWADGNTAPTKTLSGNNTGLSFPGGVEFDSDDNMYIVNFGNSGVGSVTVHGS